MASPLFQNNAWPTQLHPTDPLANYIIIMTTSFKAEIKEIKKKKISIINPITQYR